MSREEKEEIKVGNVVQLVTGGMRMTVMAVNTDESIAVAWFETAGGMSFGNTLRRDAFPAASLVRIPTETKTAKSIPTAEPMSSESELQERVEQAVEAVIVILTNRPCFDDEWNQLGANIQQEMRRDWVKVLLSTMRGEPWFRLTVHTAGDAGE
jgi:uncharacterized protein YodC (DUF2158 family)